MDGLITGAIILFKFNLNFQDFSQRDFIRSLIEATFKSTFTVISGTIRPELRYKNKTLRILIYWIGF